MSMYLTIGVGEAPNEMLERYKNTLIELLGCKEGTVILSEECVFLKHSDGPITIKVKADVISDAITVKAMDGITQDALQHTIERNWEKFLPPFVCIKGVGIPESIRDSEMPEYLADIFDSVYEDIIVNGQEIEVVGSDITLSWKREGAMLSFIPHLFDELTAELFRELEKVMR